MAEPKVDALPGELPDATGRRLAHLPAAIIGNGSLLATLSARGEYEHLFWPHVDWARHLGELRVGLNPGTVTQWLDDAPFTHEQAYLEDATVLRTAVRADDIAVRLVDFVLPDEPVAVRGIQGAAPAGTDVVVYCRPELEDSTRFGGAYVDPDARLLVFYRRGVALAVGLASANGAACGPTRPGVASGVWEQAEAGQLVPDPIGYGYVDGALIGPLTSETTIVAAFGASTAEAVERATAALAAGFEVLLARRLEHDGTRLAAVAEPVAVLDGSARMYRRSLLTIDLLADRATGAVIAAPESDADFTHSGGYGFVWGRDLAFTILALLAARCTDLVEPALQWLIRAQSPDGCWLHRHWADGSLAPSWGFHQLDETGAILVAFGAAASEDARLRSELSPPAQRAADFLCESLDPTTRLPPPTVDLWEERYAQHAYSAAAVAGGLRAASWIVRDRDRPRARAYASAARQIREAIDAAFWNEREQRYTRSRMEPTVTADGRADAGRSQMYPSPDLAAPPGSDETVDASLLGLAWPFGAVPATGPRMRATAAAVERILRLPGGGIRRYDADTYAGGNGWIVTTLWLGLSYRQAGDAAGLERSIRYALAHQTPVGLLPEQTGENGQPAWVVPLAWSHAMFTLAVRPELSFLRWLTSEAGD